MKRPLLCGVAALALSAGVGLTIHSARSADETAPAPAAAPAPAPDGPLAVGATAPDFDLHDQADLAHKLSALRGKPVVIAFYPADMTGGCTMEAHSINNALPELQKRGVTVFGVSVQGVDSKKQFCDKEGITYPLLADDQKTTARSYGVLQGGYASRVTFIIAPDGKVADVMNRVNVGSHGQDIVARLDELKLDAAPAAPATPEKVEVGKSVAAFTLPSTADNKPVTVGNWKDAKATVVLFMSARCPVSNAYNGRMKAIAANYAAKGVRVYGVNANSTETATEIAAHAKKQGFGFPVLQDAGNKIADRFTAGVTPEAYVIDAKGSLVYWGRVDDSQDAANVTKSDLKLALDAVLAGKPVPAATTRAFGCSIKRANA